MRFWKWIDGLEGGLASVGAGLCLFAMMMITVISVIGRYWLNADLIPGAYNLIERVAFPLMVFWAVPLAHREGTFPRFDIIPQKLSPRANAAVSAFVLAVEIAIFVVIMWYVTRFALNAFTSGRQMQIGTNFWPLWPVVIMIPLAFFLMLLEMFRLFWEAIRQIRNPAAAATEQKEASYDNI